LNSTTKTIQQTCHPYTKDATTITKRLKRIEGQAKGIQRMVAENRYCIDIVQQLSALSAAANEVSLMILQDHIEGCVTNAIREADGEPYIKELIATMRKALTK
jgi:DNA-binding FrmR family transcriptional regulator